MDDKTAATIHPDERIAPKPLNIVWGANIITPLICYHTFGSWPVGWPVGNGRLAPGLNAEADPEPDLRGLPVHLWRDHD